MDGTGGAVTGEAVSLETARAAVERIAGGVRRTPVLEAKALRDPPSPGQLFLKLECLQVTGSFKPRGALNKALGLDAPGGLTTASGGNHGLGVAYAASVLGVPATVFLPASTPEAKARKLRGWGAAVRVAGSVFDEANEAALAHAEAEGAVYVHPFADPAVVAGQATVGLELFDDVPDADTVLAAVGGGGLIAGIATVLKALKPSIRVIGVEPVGAPTLHDSLKAGKLVTLERIGTEAGTLAPLRSAPLNLELIAAGVDRIVLVDDEAMRQTARWLWFEAGVAAELSGAAALAALTAGAYRPDPDERVVAVVCGAGSDGLG